MQLAEERRKRERRNTKRRKSGVEEIKAADNELERESFAEGRKEEGKRGGETLKYLREEMAEKEETGGEGGKRTSLQYICISSPYGHQSHHHPLPSRSL